MMLNATTRKDRLRFADFDVVQSTANPIIGRSYCRETSWQHTPRPSAVVTTFLTMSVER